MDEPSQLTLEEINKMPTNECSCPECQATCRQARPCWGTPDEIRKIIDAGFADKLMEDYYEGDLNGVDLPYIAIITPAIRGHGGDRAPWYPRGQCIFQTDTGLCHIHSMKPVEGRVADHTTNNAFRAVHFSLVHIWNTPEGKAVVEQWRDANGFNGGKI